MLATGAFLQGALLDPIRLSAADAGWPYGPLPLSGLRRSRYALLVLTTGGFSARGLALPKLTVRW